MERDRKAGTWSTWNVTEGASVVCHVPRSTFCFPNQLIGRGSASSKPHTPVICATIVTPGAFDRLSCPIQGRTCNRAKIFPTREPGMGYDVSDLSTILLPWVAWNAERSTPPFLFPHVAGPGCARCAFQQPQHVVKCNGLENVNEPIVATLFGVVSIAVRADSNAADPAFGKLMQQA